MRRAVFLDRDGVINDVVDRGENCFVQGKHVRFTAPWRYDEFHLKAEAVAALGELKKSGLLKILATNQPDITYGTMPQAEHKRIMAEVKTLPLDDIFVCLHGRQDGCQCKKPKPGLLLLAAEKWNIDLGKSFMVGDEASDMAAGKAVGCTTILISTDRNKDVPADACAQNLTEAVKYIYENLH